MEKLERALRRRYGKENLIAVPPVDCVVRQQDVDIYYELKVYSNIRECIREAMGQLLEYAYWANSRPPGKMVIVSPNAMTREAREYMFILKDKYRLPIYYQQITEQGKLGEEQ